jgi:hypothetical protein
MDEPAAPNLARLGAFQQPPDACYEVKGFFSENRKRNTHHLPLVAIAGFPEWRVPILAKLEKSLPWSSA